MPWFLFRLKAFLKALLLPPAGPLLLMLVGFLTVNRRPILARTCLALGFGSLWLLSTPIVSEGLTYLAEYRPALDLGTPTGAQAVVILGGGGQRNYAPEYGGASAEPKLLERLAYGAYVARATGLPVLVTGFHVEARAMRETLRRNFSIDPRWVDAQAHDTFENAQNSVRMLESDGIHRIILVTHATHMRRAMREFAAAGVEVVAAPAGQFSWLDDTDPSFIPKADALVDSYNAAYELIGEPVRELLAALHLRRH